MRSGTAVLPAEATGIRRAIFPAAWSYAFFGSRRAPDDREQTEIGPLRLDVIEPMRALRLRLAPNDSGITCDLVFLSLIHI